MLKQIIKYNDFDGNPQEKAAYFYMSKPEWLKLEYSEKNESFGEMVQRLTNEKDNGKLIEIFEMLLAKAYGVRDGDRFIKSEAQWHEFTQTAAYEALFMELVTDQDKAMAFIIGLLPPELQDNANMEMKTLMLQNKQAVSTLPPPPQPGSPEETGV